MPGESSPILNTIAGAILGFGAAVFAEPLRQWIYRPKLKLEFRNDPGCRAQTPEQSQTRTADGIINSTHLAEYVRVKVTNTRPAIAKNCQAYLVAVERPDETGVFKPTIYCDSIPLAWSCRGEKAYESIDLPRGVVQFVDVISTRNLSREIRPEIKPIPYRYLDLFKEHGSFRFTIQVSGENVKPAFIKIVFAWTGIWNEYEARKD